MDESLEAKLSEHLSLYPEIHELLQLLASRVKEILGNQFTGFYVHGSLVNGDFTPQRSDIDFLVITASQLTEKMLADLEEMHTRLANSGLPWAKKLEGTYIPKEAIRRYDPAHALHPALRVDGTFAIDGHGIDWVIQRSVIRENAWTVTGPPPQELIDPISPEELRQAARGILLECWQPMLSDPTRLQTEEYRAYAVLTMCRAQYTLQYGGIAPKSLAARWAQAELSERWKKLIKLALSWPGNPEPISIEETLAFIQFTLEHFEGVY